MTPTLGARPDGLAMRLLFGPPAPFSQDYFERPPVSAAQAARRLHRTRVTAVACLGVTTTVALLMVALPAHAVVRQAASGPSISINGPNGKPADAIVTLLGITLLSVAPSLLIMMTSFTKVFVVLAMARNAMGTQTIPPNQVLAGLALFLSLFIMEPTLTSIYHQAVQPYLAGSLGFGGALHAAEVPLRAFMGPNTRQEDIALITRAAGRHNPASLAATPFLTLVPAFVLSQLRTAFIIGFVLFVPFLIIDLVVAAGLMSLGMMMLPPTMISLPFKILLFVMVDGWGLVIHSLITSYA